MNGASAHHFHSHTTPGHIRICSIPPFPPCLCNSHKLAPPPHSAVHAALSDVQEVALTEEDTREAHNIAAAAAASAAALVHIGEPVRRAVNVAEVALDPSAAVDFDAATGACMGQFP